VGESLQDAVSLLRDRRSAHKLSTEGRCLVDSVTPCVSHRAWSVRRWASRRGEREVQFLTTCTVARLSLTRSTSCDRANRTNIRKP
jgi:hypothetical protein